MITVAIYLSKLVDIFWRRDHMRRSRERQVTYFDGIALGAFCAALLFLTVFMTIDFGVSSDAWVSFVGNIVVAIFSIGAAFLALLGARTQIRQTNDLEDEKRAHSLAAAKAVLPAILSELSAIASNNMRLHFIHAPPVIGLQLPPATDFMTIPGHIIPTFKECIQFADPCSQDRLANMLRHFQVFQARHQGSELAKIEPNIALEDSNLTLRSSLSAAMGWATIHALVSDSFRYARGTEPQIPPAISGKQIRSAFITCSIMIELYPNLERLLAIRAESGRLEQDWSTD